MELIKMQKTKIVIALVAVAALTLALVGLAAAQISTNQTNPDAAPNSGVSGLPKFSLTFALVASNPFWATMTAKISFST